VGVEGDKCVCEGMSQGRGSGWKKRGEKRCVCEGVVAVRKMAGVAHIVGVAHGAL